MSAYVIVDIEVTDATEYEKYKALAPAAIASFGGRFLARGGRTETLEGDWSPNRIVVIEFESIERAKAWLASAEYAPALAIRRQNANCKMIVVEGV
jgi:uncharacterized protein (DUF1330 family)